LTVNNSQALFLEQVNGQVFFVAIGFLLSEFAIVVESSRRRRAGSPVFPL
jgi:hypothetical protein